MKAFRISPAIVILALTMGACSQQRHMRADGGPDVPQDKIDMPVEMIGDQPGGPDGDAPLDRGDVPTEVVVMAPSGSVEKGKPCSSDDNCMSGSCRDDVCCESKCEGTCVACSAAFTGLDNGVCGPVVSGMDPRGVCKDESDTSKCGQDGTCNGAGACRKQGPDRICTPASCSDGKFTASSTCDGKGTCVAGMVMSCGEFACAITGCAKPCAADGECPTGNYCSNGTCKIKKIAGESCENLNQCGSGNCSPDKVCCDSACTGACSACTETLTGQKNGTCAPVQAGKDPKDDCAAEALKSCGRDGTCDGKGGCRTYDSSVVCGEASCAGSTFSPAATCDSKGACAPVTPVSCGQAACTTGGCSQICTSNAQCNEGSYCVTAAGSCAPKKANGAACSTGECVSGACVDGVCCESACQGKCYGCSSDITGQASGRCLPIKEGRDPQNECDDSESTTCQQDGTCDGRGQCRKWPSLTPCATATCTPDNKYQSARTCDGNGTCTAATVDPCGASKCELTGCLKVCESNQQCIGNTYCDPTTKSCAAQKSQGAACATDPECMSGSCVDGVCCESACKSKCYACAFAKTTQPNGRCQPVAAGTDQDMECEGSSESSCGQDGACDGSGQCRMWGSSAKCGAAACSASGFTPVSTCDGHGTCVKPALVSCGLNTCDDVTGCRASCSPTVPCATGSYCQIAGGAATGVCMAKKASGEVCQIGNECLLGFCADGVCCNEACTGTCYACVKSQTGLSTSGVCGARTPGTDDSRCATEASACGQDGKCDGGGKCRKAADGKPCKDAMCVSNVYTGTSTCNGQGTCVTPAAQSCAPSTCSNNGPCVTSCTMDNQCTTGFYCNTTTHMCAEKKKPGDACGGTAECKVGVCADGVCCNESCGLPCQSCNLPGKAGTCSAVSGAPPAHGSCAGADSACAGSCTGATDGLCTFSTISCGTCKACSNGACKGITTQNDPMCGAVCQTCSNGACVSVTNGPDTDSCLDGMCDAGGKCLTPAVIVFDRVSPSDTDFGDVRMPGRRVRSYGVTNTGTQKSAPITISSQLGGGFSFAPVGSTGPLCISGQTMLSPGDICKIDVVYLPDNFGMATARLTVSAVGAGPPAVLDLKARCTSRSLGTEYKIPTFDAEPNQLVLGSDGRIWFSEHLHGPGSGKVGAITTNGTVTEYMVDTSGPGAGALGSDGNVWFLNGDRLVKIATNGMGTKFALSPANTFLSIGTMARGADGNFWSKRSATIHRVTPAGAVTKFDTTQTGGGFDSIVTLGPDGKIWYADNGSGAVYVANISTDGTIVKYALPAPIASVDAIASGPDGNLWYLRSFLKLGRITPAGTITEFTLPGTGNILVPRVLVAGPDGNIWIGSAFSQLGVVNTNGVLLRQLDVAGPVEGIAVGADGKIWYSEPSVCLIGKYDPGLL